MPPRTRKKRTIGHFRAGRSTTRSKGSTRAPASKRAPSRTTIPAKRTRNNTLNASNEPSTNAQGTRADEEDENQDSQLPEAEAIPTLDNYKGLMKIPELSGTKAISPYTIFLEYCLDCLNEPMPPKGAEEGGVMLGDRNVKNGQHWRALSHDERAVFDPIIFYALAGVPNPLLDSDSIEDTVGDDQDDQNHTGDSFVPVPTVHKLTVEEDELYRPIFEQKVDLKKVERELGNPSTGPSNSQLQRRSKSAIEKIAHQLSCEAHRFDFAYYLVATSTVTPNKSADLGWLKQYTTHPQVATWANKTCHLATVFATYAQGESMAKAIASVNRKEKRPRSTKQQPSDKAKVNLGRLLAALTRKTLGYIPPQSALPISVILAEGSRLTYQELKVGFKKMRVAARLEWINDIIDGHFRLVKLKVGSDETIGEPVYLDSAEAEAAMATPPREMDKVVGLNNDDASSHAASKGEKEKDRSESGSSRHDDSDED
ncbi:hypothetical protein DFH28DRAFT_1099651 [Melampsora americana]|nr:hypothetical protein DFH28DRAFT_1099651 [Melampsora americana]